MTGPALSIGVLVKVATSMVWEGARVFIARHLNAEGQPGRWGVHWIHRQRDLQGTDAEPVLLPRRMR